MRTAIAITSARRFVGALVMCTAMALVCAAFAAQQEVAPDHFDGADYQQQPIAKVNRQAKPGRRLARARRQKGPRLAVTRYGGGRTSSK